MSAVRKSGTKDRYAAFYEPVSPDSKPTLKFIKNVALGTGGTLLTPILFPIQQMGKDRFMKDSYFIELGGRPIEGTTEAIVKSSPYFRALTPDQKAIFLSVVPTEDELKKIYYGLKDPNRVTLTEGEKKKSPAEQQRILQAKRDAVVDENSWKLKHRTGMGRYSIRVKAEEVANPLAWPEMFKRVAVDLAYQVIYDKVEGVFYGDLRNGAATLRNQVPELHAQIKKTGEELKVVRSSLHKAGRDYARVQSRLGLRKKITDQQKDIGAKLVPLASVEGSLNAKINAGQALTAVEQKQWDEVQGLRRRWRDLENRRNLVGRLIRPQVASLKAKKIRLKGELASLKERAANVGAVHESLNKDLDRRDVALRRWLAPKSSGQHLGTRIGEGGNFSQWDNRREVKIWELDSPGNDPGGKLWQLQDFVKNPVGYSLRHFVWKGDPLPFLRKNVDVAIIDPKTGDFVYKTVEVPVIDPKTGGPVLVDKRDAAGKVIKDQSGNPIKEIKKRKEFVYQKDAAGNFILQKDKLGNTLKGGDGNPLKARVIETRRAKIQIDGLNLKGKLSGKLGISEGLQSDLGSIGGGLMKTGKDTIGAPFKIAQGFLKGGDEGALATLRSIKDIIADLIKTILNFILKKIGEFILQTIKQGLSQLFGGGATTALPGATTTVLPGATTVALPTATTTALSGATTTVLPAGVTTTALTTGGTLTTGALTTTGGLATVGAGAASAGAAVVPAAAGTAAAGAAAASAAAAAAVPAAAAVSAGAGAVVVEEVITGIATGGVKPAVELIIIAVGILLLLVAAIAVAVVIVIMLAVFIFSFIVGTGLKDFNASGGSAAAGQIALVKIVDVLDASGSPTGTNRITTLDNLEHRVLYTIRMTNSGSQPATNVSLTDSRCGQTFTVASVAPGASDQVIGTCEIKVVADMDKVIINEVTGSTTIDGNYIALSTSGILIVGNPADEPPSGWPISTGCITQGPGGAFSHTSTGTVYGNALDVTPSNDDGYNIKATHNGTVHVYYSTPASGRGPYPGLGYYVVLTSSTGRYSSVYAHMETISVTEGQTIFKGQFLGRVDSTVGPGGTSTGDHIHYGLSGASMDTPYIPVHVAACSDKSPDPGCGSVLNLNAGQNCFKP